MKKERKALRMPIFAQHIRTDWEIERERQLFCYIREKIEEIQNKQVAKLKEVQNDNQNIKERV